MGRGRQPGSGVSRVPAGEGAGTRGRRSPIDMSPKSVARREKRKLYMRQYRARRRLVDEAEPAAALTEAPHTVQPLIRGHRACHVASLGLDLTELALCEHEDDDDAGPSMLEYSSMWELLPQEVMDKILGLLPASSQARLRCVCKNWSDLVISCAFRDESNLLAFHRGKRNFRCYQYTLEPSEAGNYGEGAGLPILRHPTLFSGAGLVGMFEIIEESLCCWLVNMANKTSCALPPLPFLWSDSTMSDWESGQWNIWLEPTPESASSSSSSSTTLISGFQLFVMVVRGHPDEIDSSTCTLYRYSSISTGWQTLHCQVHPSWNMCWTCVPTKGGFLGYEKRKLTRMSWDSDCINHLPDVPCPLGDPLGVPVHVISDPGSGAVFGYQVDYESLLFLHRLEESSTTPRWTCVYSGLPPEFQHNVGVRAYVTKVTFLANMLVILFQSGGCSYGSYGLAYQMQDDSCQWFRLPDAQAFCYAPSDGGVSLGGVLLDPMVVSQLRL